MILNQRRKFQPFFLPLKCICLGGTRDYSSLQTSKMQTSRLALVILVVAALAETAYIQVAFFVLSVHSQESLLGIPPKIWYIVGAGGHNSLPPSIVCSQATATLTDFAWAFLTV